MFISVTILMGEGKRLSEYSVKSQPPCVGWLYYGVDGNVVRASLKRDDGYELLFLERAHLVACRGARGALIEGVEYRKKGRKHSITDRQAWWCEAPPRLVPLIDAATIIREAERAYDEEMARWHAEAG